MSELLLNIAAIAAVMVQVSVGVVFFGALTTLTLRGFGVLPPLH